MSKLSYLIPIFSLFFSATLSAENIKTGDAVYGTQAFQSYAAVSDVVVGDFNGDGHGDIAWGMPGFFSIGPESNGAVAILFGKNDIFAKELRDTSFYDNFDVRIESTHTDALFGMTLRKGDFDGDGIDDLAIASPGGESPSLYILYGQKVWPESVVEIQDPQLKTTVYYNDATSSWTALSMAVADFNRDKRDDLLFSQISRTKRKDILDSEAFIALSLKNNVGAKIKINEQKRGFIRFSRPVSQYLTMPMVCEAGDFDDDGSPDVALALPLDSGTLPHDHENGSVTLIRSPLKYRDTSILLTQPEKYDGVRIYGNQAGEHFGSSMAAGDFNHDGKIDLAVSSPKRLIKGPDNDGLISIFSGNAMPEKSGVANPAFQIAGSGGNYGIRLHAADADGDDKVDLIVSSPNANGMGGAENAGKIDIFFSKLNRSFDAGSVDKTVYGFADQRLGQSVAFGDFDGDNKIDAAIRSAGDDLGRKRTGSILLQSDHMSLPAHAKPTGLVSSLRAPSRGGELRTLSQSIKIQGKKYRVWLTETPGNRTRVCLIDKNKKIAADIAEKSNCDFAFLGPADTPAASGSIVKRNASSDDLVLAFPTWKYAQSNGVVLILPGDAIASMPPDENLDNAAVLKTSTLFSHTEDPDAGFGEKVRVCRFNNQNTLVISAPYSNLRAENGGMLHLIKLADFDKTGMHNLANADYLRIHGDTNEHFARDFECIDYNADGAQDLVITSDRAPYLLNEYRPALSILYSPGNVERKFYDIKDPELNASQYRSSGTDSFFTLKIPVDVDNDGNEDLIVLDINRSDSLGRKGAFHVFFSGKENKQGDVRNIDKDTIRRFTLLPDRNNKILDADFVGGNPTGLIVVSGSFDRTTKSKIRAVLRNTTWQGTKRPNSLKSDILDDNADEYTKLKKIDDEIWLLYPRFGRNASGEGKAERIFGHANENLIHPTTNDNGNP